MSQAEYEDARPNLAMQLWEQTSQGFRGLRGNRDQDPNAALDEFIDRYLLHPAAARILRWMAGGEGS